MVFRSVRITGEERRREAEAEQRAHEEETQRQAREARERALLEARAESSGPHVQRFQESCCHCFQIIFLGFLSIFSYLDRHMSILQPFEAQSLMALAIFANRNWGKLSTNLQRLDILNTDHDWLRNAKIHKNIHRLSKTHYGRTFSPECPLLSATLVELRVQPFGLRQDFGMSRASRCLEGQEASLRQYIGSILVIIPHHLSSPPSSLAAPG